MTVSKRSLLALGAMLVAAVSAAEPVCDLNGPELRAGTETDYILCADQPLDAAVVTTTGDADVAVVYMQPLAQCGIGDKRPGLHIGLNAARSGALRLRVTLADSGVYCQAALRAAPRVAQPAPAWLNAMPPDAERYVDVNGVRTRYFEFGAGPPLVLVHGGQAGGANNSARKWEQNVTGLAEHFRVLALDRLAQAGTENLPTPADYVDYFEHDAAHLAGFIDTLQLRDVTLVGHSQGGWPITRVALDRPAAIACVVNVDTVLVPDDFSLMRAALGFLIYTSRYVHPPGGPTVHSARRAMQLRYPSGNNITPEKAARVVAQYQAPKTREAREHMAALRMNPQHPTFKGLRDALYQDIAAGGFRARSLVVWGGQDPQVPPGLGLQFHERLVAAGVDTRFAVIDGAGHAPFVEFPEQFNALVIERCGPRSLQAGR